jgi:hypothetical protein
MKLKVTVEPLDFVVGAGLAYYAMRDGVSIEEFCENAILSALVGCEEDSKSSSPFRQ